MFSDSGYYNTSSSQDTTVVERPDDVFEDEGPSNRWHGGLDFGLLIMRLALGYTIGAHGVQKVFGTFGGPGPDEFANQLAGEGFTDHLTLLSYLGGIAEVAGGGLLVLGLFTPAAASVLLSVTAVAVYLKFDHGFFLGGDGYEFHLLLAAMAFGLLFTGPGRVSLDVNTRWRRHPAPLGFLGVVLAAGAVAAILLVFR